MDRSIIHLNIADFAAAVERNMAPELKNRSLIIAPEGSPRAIVYDMSEEAFQDGVRKGMSLGKAARISRQAKILPPSFNRYEAAMKDLIKKALNYSPLIEYGKDDGHLFIDSTGTSRLFGPAVDVAWRLNKEMKKDFCLDPVWSVASNKLVAKVATRIAKPSGEYIVAPGDEQAFLGPLPLNLIPGLSKNDLLVLKELNFFKVCQVCALTMDQLSVPFKQRALFIHSAMRGIDHSKICPGTKKQNNIKADYEFADDTNSILFLKKAVYSLIETICRQLRQTNINSSKMKMTLYYSDGLKNNAAMRILPPTSNDMKLFKKCLLLLHKTWTRRIRIRSIRLECEKTMPAQTQMELFTDTENSSKLDSVITTIDKIRKKFGNHALKPGTAMVT